MKKTILAVLAMGALSCALFSQQAQAAAITGSIAMGGTVGLNGPIQTATQVNHWFAVGTLHDGFSTVFGVSGDLDSTINVLDEATMHQPWNFGSGGAQAGLWMVGGLRSIWLRRLLSLKFPVSLMLQASEL